MLTVVIEISFGKNIRVPIPLCVVAAIRGKFPVEAGEPFVLMK